MSFLRRKSILISTPTYAGKDYAFKEYLEGILSLDLPPEYDVDVLIIENSETGDDELKYYIELAGRLEGTGVGLSHLAFPKTYPANARLTTVYNYIAAYCKSFEFDYWFSVESDVILESQHLKQLLETMINENTIGNRLKRWGKRVVAVSGVYDYGRQDKKDPTFYTMLSKNIRLGEHSVAKQVISMPFIQNGKADWIFVEVPMQRSHGFSPDAENFTREEIRAMSGPFDIASTGLGCFLADTRIFNKIIFRFTSYSDWSCDSYVVDDIKKAGWSVRGDPRVWPTHRHSPIQGDEAKKFWL